MRKTAENIVALAKGKGLGFISIAVALVLMAARTAAPPSLAYFATPTPTPVGFSQPPLPGEDDLEERMARIEGAMEQMDKRLGRVETGMSEEGRDKRAEDGLIGRDERVEGPIVERDGSTAGRDGPIEERHQGEFPVDPGAPYLDVDHHHRGHPVPRWREKQRRLK